MSSQLTTEETARESEIERGHDREVTITFKISTEALDILVPKGTTKRQLDEALTTLLACGLYTRIQNLRDLSKSESIRTHDEGNNPIVPAIRRKEELRMVGRYAQVALTHLETVALWADKAVVWTR
jgi:hypothetical protein